MNLMFGMECALYFINVQELWEDPMINATASELALINSFIIVLIIVDAIIRIGTTKSNSLDPN
jgi:hypothetical protein